MDFVILLGYFDNSHTKNIILKSMQCKILVA